MTHLFIQVDPPPVDPSFTWSDWDPYSAVGNPTTDRVEELGLIADRALIAYNIACAEWVVHRFALVLSDPIPGFFLEAAWVAEIEPRIDPPPESDEAQWKGRVRGSIDLAFMTILNAMRSAQDGKVETDAALGEQIAGHVWNWSVEFVHWRDIIVGRLQRAFPRARDDQKPIAPRMFSLSGYDVSDTEAEISGFLGSVSFSANPFLESGQHH